MGLGHCWLSTVSPQPPEGTLPQCSLSPALGARMMWGDWPGGHPGRVPRRTGASSGSEGTSGCPGVPAGRCGQRCFTHFVFLALQLLRVLKLVGLQLVQGFPELLGLVPGEGAAEREGWQVSPGRLGPGPPTPRGASSRELLLAEVVDVEGLPPLGQDFLLHLPGRLLLASLLVSLRGHDSGDVARPA